MTPRAEDRGQPLEIKYQRYFRDGKFIVLKTYNLAALQRNWIWEDLQIRMSSKPTGCRVRMFFNVVGKQKANSSVLAQVNES